MKSVSQHAWKCRNDRNGFLSENVTRLKQMFRGEQGEQNRRKPEINEDIKRLTKINSTNQIKFENMGL